AVMFDDSDAPFILFGLLLGLFFLVGVPIMAVVAYRRSGELRDHLIKLQSRIAALEKQQAESAQKFAGDTPSEMVTPQPAPAASPQAAPPQALPMAEAPPVVAPPVSPMAPEENAPLPVEPAI